MQLRELHPWNVAPDQAAEIHLAPAIATEQQQLL